jgi:oligopeptide/dipeptide ABC transporter ATP-binding protein
MIEGAQGRDVAVRTTGRSPVTLVDGFGIDVAPGEMVGIVGETGAGKTVTMRALLGLLPQGLRGEGTLSVAGQDVSLAEVGSVRRLLGDQTSVVLQNPMSMLDPFMRVRDQLVEGAVRRGGMDPDAARERAAALLGQMGFSDVEAVMALYPHQLSGGMAQRVATTMGMMPQPRLLVLDEPTSALDAGVRVAVLRAFARAASEQRTGVILVSHDLGLVSHFCDSVTVMYSGRAVEQGATAQIVSTPAHPYTVALLEASATLEVARRQALTAIAGAPPSPRARPSGCTFAPRCPHATDICIAERPVLVGSAAHRFACHHPRTGGESR